MNHSDDNIYMQYKNTSNKFRVLYVTKCGFLFTKLSAACTLKG